MFYTFSTAKKSRSPDSPDLHGKNTSPSIRVDP